MSIEFLLQKDVCISGWSLQIQPFLRHPTSQMSSESEHATYRELGARDHLPELLQVFFLKEKKNNQATFNNSNNSNLFVNKTSVPPNRSESKHTLCWSPHKRYDLIHQIQFLMCTCFCLFACLFCCFIKRGKWTTTLKNSLAASYKIKPTPTTKSSNCTQGNLPQRNESKYPHKILCIKVFQQLYSKQPKSGGNLCIYVFMNKKREIVVHPYNRAHLSNERGQAIDSGSNTNLKNMLSEKKPDLRMRTV